MTLAFVTSEFSRERKREEGKEGGWKRDGEREKGGERETKEERDNILDI